MENNMATARKVPQPFMTLVNQTNKKKKKPYPKIKKLSGDWDTTKPNILKISAKYANKGTILVGWLLDGKAWRIGHSASQIHEKTCIVIEGGALYEIPTERLFAFIHETNPSWLNAKYGIFDTKCYQIELQDLLDFCNQKEKANG